MQRRNAAADSTTPDRVLAQRMRGYANAQARYIFRDLIDIPPTSLRLGVLQTL